MNEQPSVSSSMSSAEVPPQSLQPTSPEAAEFDLDAISTSEERQAARAIFLEKHDNRAPVIGNEADRLDFMEALDQVQKKDKN